jgi:DNA polymerase I-like protein with 3'-5' exonuclease and polymerase domains
MANIPRSQAKTINLGLFYGMGKNKLQAELGVSKENAEDLFRTYHDKVPFVKMLMESVMRRAQTKVRVRTLLGRRCRFNLWEPNSLVYIKLDSRRCVHGTWTRDQKSFYIQSIK